MTETQGMNLFVGCYAIVVFLLPFVRFALNIGLQHHRRIAPLKIDWWIRNGRNALHPEAIQFGEYVRRELKRVLLIWSVGFFLLGILTFIVSKQAWQMSSTGN